MEGAGGAARKHHARRMKVRPAARRAEAANAARGLCREAKRAEARAGD
jgi:hypothetical protein